MEYLKIWTSFREVIAPLCDDEKGRLFDAMLQYAESGREPDLEGNERFVWPAARQIINRTAQKAEILRQNGSSPKNKDKQNEANQSKNKQSEAKQSKPEQSEATYSIKKSNSNNTPTPTTTRTREDQFGEVLDLDPVIVTIQRELTGMTMDHYDDLETYRQDLGDDLIIEAVNDAVAHGVRQWAYVRKVLARYLRDGIRTVGEAREAHGRGRTGKEHQGDHRADKREDEDYDLSGLECLRL